MKLILFNFMLIALISILLWSTDLVEAQSNPHCMYVQNVELFKADLTAMSLGSSYSYTITWNQVQSNLSSYSYAFSGYELFRAFVDLSFASDMVNVTSNNAIFIINPKASNHIAKIMFSVMLFSHCVDQLILRQYDFSGDKDISVQINIGIFIGNDTSRYSSITYFKYFEQQNSTAVGQVYISLSSFQVGVNYQTLNITTQINMQLCKIGYLLFVQKQIKPLIQTVTIYSWIVQPLVFSSVFLANTIKQCFLGLRYIQELPNSNSSIPYFAKPQQPILTPNVDIKFPSSISSLEIAKYTCICLAKCPNGTVPSNSGLSLKCLPCPTNLSNCITCRSSEGCLECEQSFYTDEFSKCQPCYSKFQNCYLCSIDNCTLCLKGYLLSPNGGIGQCVKCSSLISHCETCSFAGSNITCNTCSLEYYAFQPCQNITNCTAICLPCLEECIECTDSSSCLKCKSGSQVSGGCSDIKACIRVNSSLSYLANRCTQCEFPSAVDANGTCNSCYHGYFLISSLCVNVIGCISANKQNHGAKCILCNQRQNFQSTPISNKCVCKKGFHNINNTCTEICGDGMAFTFKCDDGNSVGGDGCSENCTIEQSFQCSKADDQNSNCIIIKQISVKLIKTEKVTFQNQAIFTFAFSPKITISKFVETNGILFVTNRSHSAVSHSFADNTVSIRVKYAEDLQNYDADVTVILREDKSILPQVQISFKMQKDGLLIMQESQSSEKIAEVVKFISLIIVILFLLSPLVHKMIGYELLFTLQVYYLTNLQNEKPSEGLTTLYKLGLSCFNFQAYFDDYSHILSKGTSQEFRLESMEGSILTMVSLLAGALLGYAVFHITKSRAYPKENKNRRFRWDFFGFWMQNLLFSLSVGFTVTELLVITTSIQQTQQLWFKRSAMVIQVATAIFFFRERFKKPQAKQTNAFSQLQNLSKPYYIPLFLDLTLLNAAVFALSFNELLQQRELILIAAFFLFMLTVILIPPCKNIVDNAGVLINLFIVIGFLTWFYARKYITLLFQCYNQVLALICLIGSIILSMLITIIRLLMKAKQLYLLHLKNYKISKINQGQIQSEFSNQIANNLNKPFIKQHLRYKAIMKQEIPINLFQGINHKIIKGKNQIKNEMLARFNLKQKKDKKYRAKQQNQ